MGNPYIRHVLARSRPAKEYDAGWSVERLARHLRMEADKGFMRGVDPKADVDYRDKCAARHRPSHLSVIFTRDKFFGGTLMGYHASLCFIGEGEYLAWDDAMAERWLCALFGEDRIRAKDVTAAFVSEIGKPKGVRHFFLEVNEW